MDIIKEMAKKNNQTIVMVTHDKSLTRYADRIIHILDGKIQEIIEVNSGDSADTAISENEQVGDIKNENVLPAGS